MLTFLKGIAGPGSQPPTQVAVGQWAPWKSKDESLPEFMADAVGSRIQDPPAQPPLPGHSTGEDRGDPRQP